MADDWIDLRRRDGVTLRVIPTPAWSLDPPNAVAAVQVGYPDCMDALSYAQYLNFIFSMRYYGRWLAYDKSEQDTE